MEDFLLCHRKRSQGTVEVDELQQIRSRKKAAVIAIEILERGERIERMLLRQDLPQDLDRTLLLSDGGQEARSRGRRFSAQVEHFSKQTPQQD
jgi:hypothetical protein